MTPDERRMLGEMAAELLAAGRADQLVAELVDSGLAEEVWADDEALAVVFGAEGGSAAASLLLDHAALRPSGELPGRLVLPVPGTSGSPAWVDGRRLVVDGVVLAGAGDRYAVGLDTGELVLVAGLEAADAPGLDPGLGVVRVRGVLDRAAARDADADWPAVAVRAARALAYALLGVAGAALDRAVGHVIERQQFGRPLAAFQVVRHRLAGVAIARTGAEELARASGPAIGPDEAVLVVKATAGRAALLAVQEAQQVCGGMGFTEEFGLHRLVRRAYLLDSLFGGCESAESDLGAVALATGRIPEPAVAL